MNFVKPASIVFVLAIGAAAVAVSASAQQPTPLPHVPIGLPVQAPGRWSQHDWDAARGRCQALADKDAAHIRFSPLDNSAEEACMSLSWGLNQQPTAAPTAAAPRNPYWCAGVPASPPPPKFSAEVWASVRHMCTNNDSVTCMHECEAAMDLWERRNEGDFDHPPTSNSPATPTPLKHSQVPLEGGGRVDGYSSSAPAATNLEGPFPLRGGAKAL